MNRSDVYLVVMVAALMMSGVATWAAFTARAQVELDAQDSRDLAESNLEMIEALGAKLHQQTSEPTALVPAVEGDVGPELASLREALAEANKRISRVQTQRAELHDRVRRHIEETDALTARLADAERKVERLLERIRHLEERVPKGEPVDLGRTE